METPTQAIILAAGKGTRLGSLTADCPKALVRVGDRVLLDHVRFGLAQAGVRRAMIVISHLAEQIEAHLQANPVPGQTSLTVWQPAPQGTGQAVRMAIPEMERGPTWITYADIVVEPDEYQRMAAAAAGYTCDMVLAVVDVDDPCRGAAVYFDDRFRISRIIEKPSPGTSTTRWNSAGIYLTRPSLFPYLNELMPSTRGEYELPDAVTSLMAAGGEVYAFPLAGPWIDVGRPEDIERAEQMLRRRKEASKGK